jgi:hypothetical protein
MIITDFIPYDQRVQEVGEERASQLLRASEFCFFLLGLLDKSEIRRFLEAQSIRRLLFIATIFELGTLPKDGEKASLIDQILELVTAF